MASTTTNQQHKLPATTRHRFVLTDPIAFRYLEDDPSTQVLARREVLHGYECYLVEQWACSRTDPTFIITTFTADEQSTVVGSVLSVPEKKDAWSARLTLYFESLRRYNARPKETPLGTIMVTNLSGFPSSLTVIPIPNQGDVRASREAFFVNENLKRLGCAGRVGLTLGTPTAATTAKFYQLYRASDKIPLNMAVIELVKLCQVALVIFGELLPEYADGLLCDFTEKAITDWWIEFGTEYFSIEPHDGILGPTTVAALLGTLIGARNRLHAYGATIGKDVFDIESTKRAIAAFQKGHKMSKTRRLDRQTLARIHRSTAKAASGDGWFVPRAVKSTMAELSGKGGEMVMDMVGAGNKAGIAEVETVDIEQFVQHVQGDRAKWLWRGKPRKEPVVRPSQNEPASSLMILPEDFSKDKTVKQQNIPEDPVADVAVTTSKLARKPHLEKHILSRPAEGSRKLGRIKGAVGLSHGSKSSKDDSGKSEFSACEGLSATRILDSAVRASPPAYDNPATAFSPSLMAQDSKAVSSLTEIPDETLSLQPDNSGQASESEALYEHENRYPPYLPKPHRSNSPSICGSNYKGVDLHDLFNRNAVDLADFGPGFKRTQSFPQMDVSGQRPNTARWPRHLSFSLAADSVLTWERLEEPELQDSGALIETSNAERSLRMREHLQTLDLNITDWVNMELQEVETIRAALDEAQKNLDVSHHEKSEEFREFSNEAKEIMEYERAQLEESAKETEVLGAKLEYEINVLRGKVDDVEDGVSEFARQVNQVEERVRQLEQAMVPKERWSLWFIRKLKGIGQEDQVE